MDIVAAIKARKSIRAFKSTAVPKSTIHEILEVSTRSTSASNSQPWQFAVLTGRVLDDVKRENIAAFDSGDRGSMAFMAKPYEPVYQARREVMAAELLRLQGIGRDDKEKRMDYAKKGFRFFDAPVAIIVAADSSISDARGQFDIGSVCETICLAALNYGLGTIIAIQPIAYPAIIRKYTGIPESWNLSASVSIGYPDLDAPINANHTLREPVDKVTCWLGFE